MSNNSGQNGFSGNNNNGGGKEDNTLFHVCSWILTVIMLSAFWPVGLIMLFLNLSGKIDKFNPKRFFGSSSSSSGTRQQPVTRSGVTYQPNTSSVRPTGTAGAGGAPSSQTAQSKAPRSVFGKKNASLSKAANILLLALGVILILAGGSMIAEELRYVQYGVVWSQIIQGIFYIIGGAGSLIARHFSRRRAARFNKYSTIVNTNTSSDNGLISIKAIAASSGVDMKTVRKEIAAMIEKGYFGENAYIDSEIDSLVLTPEAAEKIRQFAQTAAKKASEEVHSQSGEHSNDKYADIIAELKRLDVDIEDKVISGKIVRIEELAEKIFDIVDDAPEKLPQIRKFMDYYLPTTLKLLRSYSVLEKQGIDGQNISSAKADIDRI
ncbi:MAG: 5-bromo-4-chloroindolyl phosphate hydrolysis family protein, partial [Oscillospiraceae bacterium]|nr:5-bromo-4-chloroindolyl phosphate hydrolysis family protein [Oscillospiraceae bacterium]